MNSKITLYVKYYNIYNNVMLQHHAEIVTQHK